VPKEGGKARAAVWSRHSLLFFSFKSRRGKGNKRPLHFRGLRKHSSFLPPSLRKRLGYGEREGGEQ